MATDQPCDASELSAVRYPSKLLSSLDAFVSILRNSVLKDSAYRAIERRGHGSGSTKVSADDFLAATRAAIPHALEELEKALEREESSYARRAS
jgi:hypothetical protein